MFCCEAWFSYGVVELLAGASAKIHGPTTPSKRETGDGDTWESFGGRDAVEGWCGHNLTVCPFSFSKMQVGHIQKYYLFGLSVFSLFWVGFRLIMMGDLPLNWKKV